LPGVLTSVRANHDHDDDGDGDDDDDDDDAGDDDDDDDADADANQHGMVTCSMGWEIYKSSVNRYDPQPRPESRNACGPAVPAKHAAPRHPSRSVAILALVETHRGNHGAKTRGGNHKPWIKENQMMIRLDQKIWIST